MSKIIGSALKELKSVGSCIDIDLGIVYPLNEDSTPDWDSPIELLDDEVSSEWIAALSSEDYQICKPFIESIDVKQLANDVIKYGILETKESKELTNWIMNRNM